MSKPKKEKTASKRKILALVVIAFAVAPLLINVGLVITDFIYDKTGATLTAYDMSMHEYNFELEGEYCEADINNYFQSKEEKRQRELRDSKYKFWK